MNNFVINTPDNFWQIRWLDKYMEGHKGFIAGGSGAGSRRAMDASRGGAGVLLWIDRG